MSSRLTGMSASTLHPEHVPVTEENALQLEEKGAKPEVQAANNLVENEPPDGGYGWVIVACVFMINAVSWGINSAFGVFLSFYAKNDFFPGSKEIDFAVIGGLSVGCAMMVAPLSNYFAKRFANFKVPLCLGIVIYFAAQILAGFSTKIWQLYLTQGFLFGIGLGFVYVPIMPLANQWFSKKRALAAGICSSGAGAGAIVFSLVVQATIEHLGLRWAFIINALISTGVLLPMMIILKSPTSMTSPAKFEPLQPRLLVHPGLYPVYLWGAFTILGYLVTLFTTATYATSGLGLSQSKGAIVQSLFAVGQMTGRPLVGLLMDKWGRINLAIIWTILAGLSCLVIWMFARNEGVLLLFALVQGMSGGTFWSASTPIVTDIVGVADLGSALSFIWLSVLPSSIISEPIAIWLLAEAQRRTGIMLPAAHSQGGTNHGVSGAGTGDTTGAIVFRTTIAFAGSTYMMGALVLYLAKRWKQSSWKIFVKT